MMNPKMKGLFKGLKYISHVFEEEKEQEMQIGLPTDVKHVAHIGSDGPANDAPSWMKEFNSGSLEAKEDESAADNSSVKWVSEDSKRGAKPASSPGRDIQEVPKPSRRRNSSESNSAGDSSPKKRDPSAKPRATRRSKESSAEGGSVKTSRQLRESSGQASDSAPSGNPPDVPKKTRRKKSKDSVANTNGNGNGSARSRTKASGANSDEGTGRKSGAQDED